MSKTYERVYGLMKSVEENSKAKYRKEITAAFNAEIETAYRIVHPRIKKFNEQKMQKEMPDQYRAIWNKWKKITDMRFSGMYNIIDNAKEMLYRLAKTCDLTPQNEMQCVYTLNSECYRTQGWGQDKYTRISVEERAECVRAHGFTAEIRCVAGKYTNDYELWAYCTPVQYDACTRLPYQTVGDWVKWCYAHGVSPKVLNPFIPNDLLV